MSRPPHGDPRRQLFLLKFSVGFLIFFALIILVLPGVIPKPLRIFIAVIDLLAAATIWLLGRQKFPR
ncbi:hypothetical protein [Synoicihabitans lomoniglobus]|uniref:Uncharacterized protein n=1 Tax=Synoicihabitans lomoniglobus TaxID=2909285 RepID=A0AAF0CP62_9BACT|nr:hypothetical protein [Opitutaceae bacterium LMO-M01]WED63439.1 hypothetical protein PXH66_13955 [Opitutaceae bacterium LMO-M01]